MMQTILMIGLGKIGLPVAKQLAAQGHCVIGVSRSTPTDLAFCNPMTAKLPPDSDNLYQQNIHFVAVWYLFLQQAFTDKTRAKLLISIPLCSRQRAPLLK